MRKIWLLAAFAAGVVAALPFNIELWLDAGDFRGIGLEMPSENVPFCQPESEVRAI